MIGAFQVVQLFHHSSSATASILHSRLLLLGLKNKDKKPVNLDIYLTLAFVTILPWSASKALHFDSTIPFSIAFTQAGNILHNKG